MPRRRRVSPPRPTHEVVYWDACVWIAWLNNEIRKPGEMEGVIASVEHIMAGRSTLILHRVITDNEVKQDRLTPETRDLFSRALSRPNVVKIDYEPPIMALTNELDRFYKKELRAGRVKEDLTFFDAIHLATAINRRVDAFYTFDKGQRGGLDLLALSGNVGGHALQICKPAYEQAPILFR